MHVQPHMQKTAAATNASIVCTAQQLLHAFVKYDAIAMALHTTSINVTSWLLHTLYYTDAENLHTLS